MQNGNSRIAKNTVIVYIRLFVTMAVGLVTARFVLQALGKSDFGLYNVVGGIIAMFTFISGSLSSTTVRFMNFEMGKPAGNPNRMFNACYALHIGFALLILLLLEVIGVFYNNNFLNIEPGRESDAMFVFQVSTITACIGIINIPFQSQFIVHEKFSVIAAVDILNAFIKLGLVLILLRYNGNALRFYAVAMSVMTLVSFIAYRVVARRLWPDQVRLSFGNKKAAFHDLIIFNNWNLLSTASMVIRSQGSNLLINWFFGTGLNAAYAIGNQVQQYVNTFVANFDTAAVPQITQNLGAGKYDRSFYLVCKTCKICILLMELVFFTLIVELDTVLDLWLGVGNVPEGTLQFCSYTLLIAVVSSTSGGLGQYINASGKVKWFKLTLSLLYFSCIIFGWLAFKAGMPPYTIIILFVISDAVCRIFQLLLAHRLLDFDSIKFMKEAYLRPLAVGVVMTGYVLLYRQIEIESIGWKLTGICVTAIVCGCLIAIIGFTKYEIVNVFRKFFLDHAHSFVVDCEWEKSKGCKVDWAHPRDFNEKVQWLICKSDTSKWTELADKYRVRDFVRSKGYGDLLVPILGVWSRAEDIDYDALPQKFVLKCNHDSGSTHIIDKTIGFDKDMVNAELNAALRVKYGYVHGEMFYNGIRPQIIAERFIKQDGALFSTSLIDYKVFCFNGKPHSVCAYYSRSAEAVYIDQYDLDWNVIAGAISPTAHYRLGGGKVPKPENLKEILSAATALSEGFPEVRVDFYSTGGRLYFGEMTFSTSCGKIDYYSQEFLEELGRHCDLSLAPVACK